MSEQGIPVQKWGALNKIREACQNQSDVSITWEELLSLASLFDGLNKLLECRALQIKNLRKRAAYRTKKITQLQESDNLVYELLEERALQIKNLQEHASYQVRKIANLKEANAILRNEVQNAKDCCNTDYKTKYFAVKKRVRDALGVVSDDVICELLAPTTQSPVGRAAKYAFDVKKILDKALKV